MTTLEEEGKKNSVGKLAVLFQIETQVAFLYF